MIQLSKEEKDIKLKKNKTAVCGQVKVQKL